MALLYGLKAISPVTTTARPHILGFSTPRTGTDSLAEIWNDDTGTDWKLRSLVDALHLRQDLKFVDASYDIGKSGATRPRDGFFSRNVTADAHLGGGTVASAGVFRTANNVASLTARNAGNTGDLTMISSDSSDRVSIRSGELLVGPSSSAFAGGLSIGGNVGFFGGAQVAKPTGVAVSAAGIHAALVSLNLIGA